MYNTKPESKTQGTREGMKNTKHSTPSNNQWLLRVRDKVRAQMSHSDLTIESIASQMLMSERQFFRKVKRTARCTPNQLIQLWRLEYARELLQSGEVENLSYLARRVGYAKSDYFSKLYEKQYGVRPVEHIDVF